MRDLDYMLSVITAAKEGKQIQYCNRDGSNVVWQNCPISAIIWDWNTCDYRVKPEPEIIKLSERGMHAELVRGEQWKVGLGDPHYLYLSPFEIDNLYQASRKARGIEEPKYIEPSDVLLEKLEGIVQYESISKAARKVFRLGYEAHKAALEKQS